MILINVLIQTVNDKEVTITSFTNYDEDASTDEIVILNSIMEAVSSQVSHMEYESEVKYPTQSE